MAARPIAPPVSTTSPRFHLKKVFLFLLGTILAVQLSRSSPRGEPEVSPSSGPVDVTIYDLGGGVQVFNSVPSHTTIACLESDYLNAAQGTYQFVFNNTILGDIMQPLSALLDNSHQQAAGPLTFVAIRSAPVANPVDALHAVLTNDNNSETDKRLALEEKLGPRGDENSREERLTQVWENLLGELDPSKNSADTSRRAFEALAFLKQWETSSPGAGSLDGQAGERAQSTEKYFVGGLKTAAHSSQQARATACAAADLSLRQAVARNLVQKKTAVRARNAVVRSSSTGVPEEWFGSCHSSGNHTVEESLALPPAERHQNQSEEERDYLDECDRAFKDAERSWQHRRQALAVLNAAKEHLGLQPWQAGNTTVVDAAIPLKTACVAFSRDGGASLGHQAASVTAIRHLAESPRVSIENIVVFLQERGHRSGWEQLRELLMLGDGTETDKGGRSLRSLTSEEFVGAIADKMAQSTVNPDADTLVRLSDAGNGRRRRISVARFQDSGLSLKCDLAVAAGVDGSQGDSNEELERKLFGNTEIGFGFVVVQPTGWVNTEDTARGLAHFAVAKRESMIGSVGEGGTTQRQTAETFALSEQQARFGVLAPRHGAPDLLAFPTMTSLSPFSRALLDTPEVAYVLVYNGRLTQSSAPREAFGEFRKWLTELLKPLKAALAKQRKRLVLVVQQHSNHDLASNTRSTLLAGGGDEEAELDEAERKHLLTHEDMRSDEWASSGENILQKLSAFDDYVLLQKKLPKLEFETLLQNAAFAIVESSNSAQVRRMGHESGPPRGAGAAAAPFPAQGAEERSAGAEPAAQRELRQNAPGMWRPFVFMGDEQGTKSFLREGHVGEVVRSWPAYSYLQEHLGLLNNWSAGEEERARLGKDLQEVLSRVLRLNSESDRSDEMKAAAFFQELYQATDSSSTGMVTDKLDKLLEKTFFGDNYSRHSA